MFTSWTLQLSLAPLKYVMVVELVSGPLRFISRQKYMSDRGTWSSQKAYLEAYLIHYHGPMRFTMRGVKEVFSLQKTGDHDKEITFQFFNICHHIYDKIIIRRGAKGQTWRKILKLLFLVIYIKKTSISTFWCMVTSLGPHPVYT